MQGREGEKEMDMIDKSKRYVRPTFALQDVVTLKGKRIEFESIAEMMTVRAKEIPENVYFQYYEEVVTYAQTNERANRVANYLKEKGIKKGDFVSVMTLNAPEICYTMFGAQKLGASPADQLHVKRTGNRLCPGRLQTQGGVYGQRIHGGICQGMAPSRTQTDCG